MLERVFRLRDMGTTVRAELIGGATTFVTLSYIIFVQPAVYLQRSSRFHRQPDGDASKKELGRAGGD